MVKLFRRIRQKLINEGNLKRYLIYAIGEILLVMIGILLALQINNWNEKQKADIRENILIENIQEELQEEYVNLEYIFDKCAKGIQDLEIYLNLKSSNVELKLGDLLWLAGHLPAALEIPLINSILSGNESSAIKNIELLEELRELNSINEKIKSFDSYMDEIWNNKVSNFLIDNNYALEMVRLNYSTSDEKNDNTQTIALYRNVEYQNLMAAKLILQKEWVHYQEVALEQINKILALINN